MEKLSRLRNAGIVGVTLASLASSVFLGGCLRPVLVGDVVMPMTEKEYKEFKQNKDYDSAEQSKNSQDYKLYKIIVD